MLDSTHAASYPSDTLLDEVSATALLRSLHVSSDLVTDAGIISVVKHCRIESLLLSGVPNVTDRALESIAHCETVRELYLEGTSVTDDGLGLLRQLPDLWSLVIDRTSITDCGVCELGSS